LLGDYEVPVAKSVMHLLGRIDLSTYDEDVFIKYIMLWIAFNNIYVTIANQEGIQRKPEFNTSDNSLKTITTKDSIILPKMSRVTERDQIDVAYENFSEGIKDELIKHKSTKFFVYRKPKWNGIPFEKDNTGQIVNGVINLGCTYSEDYPYWSPIDIKKYEKYIGGEESPKLRDCLAKQIVSLLYTVRNNTFHGGKRFDDANDRNVIEKAIPLLKKVVNYFYRYERSIH
jgi:hypothetical protein